MGERSLHAAQPGRTNSGGLPPAEDLAHFFDTSLDLLCIADFDGHFLHVNPAWSHVLGYTEQELVQRPFLDFVHPDDVEATLAQMRGLSDDDDTLNFENRYRAADGRWVWLSWNARPDARTQRIYAVAKDVSHLKKIEATLAARNAALEQADRMKREFLANMSHELRTPLNAILGFSDLLRDGLVGELNGEQGEYVSHIYDSGHHLLHLINEILDLSRVEAGVLTLERQHVDVRTLLRRCLAVLHDAAGARGVSLSLDVDDRVGTGWLDPVRVRQIVYNLLSNAIKFSHEGGRVVLTARRDDADGALVMSVSDDGIGIDPDDHERLFEPFVQVDGSTTRRFDGAGLGLALVRRLSELHGGDVRCDSTLGEGTTFSVRLPGVEHAPEPT